MAHDSFEWDEAKAASNLRKHGISFDFAAEVLADPWADVFHIDLPQDMRGEDRWLTYASHPARRDIVLAIAWTQRHDVPGPLTRIISARKVQPHERSRYEKEIRPDRA